MRKIKLGLTIGAALLAIGLSAPASATPVGAGAVAVAADLQSSTGIENVHLRRYRHCHGPRGNRWCHGPHYGYGYYPYYGPGINLYFGPSYRYRGYRGHHRGHHGGRRGH
jgi:hypothetical protein